MEIYHNYKFKNFSNKEKLEIQNYDVTQKDVIMQDLMQKIFIVLITDKS